MTDDLKTKQIKQWHKQYIKKLKALEKRIENHIDDNGDCILDLYPYYVELPTPIIDLGDFVGWLSENFHKKDYLRPWPNLVYFKNEEDAMAFKLRWI